MLQASLTKSKHTRVESSAEKSPTKSIKSVEGLSPGVFSIEETGEGNTRENEGTGATFSNDQITGDKRNDDDSDIERKVKKNIYP